jgi:hypothetical protein
MTICTTHWPNPLGLRIVHSYEEWREARWPTIRARSGDEVHALVRRATTPPAPQREFLLPLRGGRDGVAACTPISSDKTVTVGVTFDKETWAKAKPLFIQAAKGAAGDVNQLMRLLIKELHVNYKMSEQAIREMRVYLIRFVQEVRAGTIMLQQESEGSCYNSVDSPVAPSLSDPLVWVDSDSGREIVSGESFLALSDGAGNWSFGAEAVVMPADWRENFSAISGKEADKVVQSLSAALSCNKWKREPT